MNHILLVKVNCSSEMNNQAGYIIGVVLALFILAYLLYALVKPEKF